MSSSAKPRKLPSQETGGPQWAGDTGTLGCAPFSLRVRSLLRESDYRETKYDSSALGEILDLKKMIRSPTPSRIWHLEFAKFLKRKKKVCLRSLLQHSGSLGLTGDLLLWYTGCPPAAACGLSSCGAWAELLHGMWGLGAPTRDQTRDPCISRQILNCWATREVSCTVFLRA